MGLTPQTPGHSVLIIARLVFDRAQGRAARFVWRGIWHGSRWSSQKLLDNRCNTRHSTPVVPFSCVFEAGIPVHEQVGYAARKAIVSGRLRPGDAFPSVRALSKAMKIHANTAQKVIAQLVAEGLLEVHPGIGTVVCHAPSGARAERSRLLGREVEQLTVEAMRLGLTLEDVQSAMAASWRKLRPEEGE
jgi:GntR family transcriptional regulator